MRWRHTWLGALDGRAGSGCRNLGCSITHSHTRAHTHSPKLKCSRQPSVSLLSHRRTHAEAPRHAHAHTSAGVAGAPRVFKACTQSGVRVRAGAHVCVCVRGSARVQRLRTHANVCAPAGCVPPLAGMQTSEPLHGFFPPRVLPISVYYLRVFRGLGLDKRSCHLRDDRNHQRDFGARRAMTDTARLRNVQAARKNSVDKVSDILACTRTA